MNLNCHHYLITSTVTIYTDFAKQRFTLDSFDWIFGENNTDSMWFAIEYGITSSRYSTVAAFSKKFNTLIPIIYSILSSSFIFWIGDRTPLLDQNLFVFIVEMMMSHPLLLLVRLRSYEKYISISNAFKNFIRLKTKIFCLIDFN